MIEHQKRNKSLKQILEADNLDEINKWLKGLPLLLKIKIKTNIYWIAHAGIPFLWDFKIAQQLSKEIQSAIRNDAYNLFENMWGDTPSLWNPELEKYKSIIESAVVQWIKMEGQWDEIVKEDANLPPIVEIKDTELSESNNSSLYGTFFGIDVYKVNENLITYRDQ